MKLEDLKNKLQEAIKQINSSIEELNTKIYIKYRVIIYSKSPAKAEIKEWEKGKYHRYYANILVEWHFYGKKRGDLASFGTARTRRFNCGYLNANTNRYSKDNKSYKTKNINLSATVPDVSYIVDEIKKEYLRFAKETIKVNQLSVIEYDNYKERKRIIKKRIEEKVLKIGYCTEDDYEIYNLIKKIAKKEIKYDKESDYYYPLYYFIWYFNDNNGSEDILNMTSDEAIEYCKKIVSAIEPENNISS